MKKPLFLLLAVFLFGIAFQATSCKKKTEDTVEACTDGEDNDKDGFTDCNDLDCTTVIECDCFDGQDNDGDGFTDCDDLNCTDGKECNCTDGTDNDMDGLTDCNDPDCDGHPSC